MTCNHFCLVLLQSVWLILYTIHANSLPYKALAVASRASSACVSVCSLQMVSPLMEVNVVIRDCSNSTGSRSSSLTTVDTTGLLDTLASSRPFFTTNWMSPMCSTAAKIRNIVSTSCKKSYYIMIQYIHTSVEKSTTSKHWQTTSNEVLYSSCVRMCSSLS